jgi:hypothetical protein
MMNCVYKPLSLARAEIDPNEVSVGLSGFV